MTAQGPIARLGGIGRILIAALGEGTGHTACEAWTSLRAPEGWTRPRPDLPFAVAHRHFDTAEFVKSAPNATTPETLTRTAAQIVLRQWLGDIARTAGEDLPFRKGPFGKPALPPEFGLHFSLSWRRGWVAIAVSDRAPVGIDLELVPDRDTARAVGNWFFHPSEIAASTAAASDACRTFARLWTRKEALCKAAGLSLDRMRGARTEDIAPYLEDAHGRRRAYRVATIEDGDPIKMVSVAWDAGPPAGAVSAEAGAISQPVR